MENLMSSFIVIAGVLIVIMIMMFLILSRVAKQREALLRIDAYLMAQQQQFDALYKSTLEQQHQVENAFAKLGNDIRDVLIKQFADQHKTVSEFQLDTMQRLQVNFQNGMTDIRHQLNETLINNAKLVAQQMDKLTQTTEQRLKEISGQVERRLTEGFEKTTATFVDIIKRLALIDEAQKKITELSNNVMSLQEVLSDKRSRGAFGEVQLAALIRNVMPENHFALQHTLSNEKRVDCILFLSPPTGNIAIDAKFPLETYRVMTNVSVTETERQLARQQFKQDIRKHIQDIAEKYIIPGETSDGAIMFIPAEAVFAEIHAHYPDLVEYSQQMRVWMVSPTTMMAILTTARAVIKDDATRKQVNIIQEHLRQLAKNFELFRMRMDKLAQHIKQANTDVEQIHTSAQKITSHFERIEKVEFENSPLPELDLMQE